MTCQQQTRAHDVQSLLNRCADFLENEVRPENAFDVFQAARMCRKMELMKKAGGFVAKSLHELPLIEIYRSFIRLDKLTLIEILKRNDLKMKEIELFRVVRKWANEQSGFTEQQNLQDVLPHIRFPLMTPREIRTLVKPARLLSEDMLSTLSDYFQADIETKNVLASTLMFDTRRRQSPDLIASVSLYSCDLTNRRTSWDQFQELKECMQFKTLVYYLAKPPQNGRSLFGTNHASRTTVGLSGISVCCPASAKFGAVPGSTFPASYKKFKITVKLKDCFDGCDVSCEIHCNDLLTLSNVEVEEGKITDTEFGTVIRMEQGKHYCITVEEVRTVKSAKKQRRDQIYDAKHFGSVRKWIFADVGNKCVNIQGIQRNQLCSYRQIRYEEPQLICKLGLEELL